MKKKKKKAIPLDLEDAAPASSAGEESPAATGSSTPEPSAAAAAAAADDDKPAEDAGEMFADLKKKKKKKKAAAFAAELDELDAEKAEEDGVTETLEGVETGGIDPWVAEKRNPTYPELLKRFYTLLHVNNPELAGEKRRYTIVPPQVTREGTKKTSFTNFVDICRRMHRQTDHVKAFLYAELGTHGSIDAANRLIMRGRFNQKQIENVLRKYIVEYVTCKICKSPETLLGKENRLYFLTCEACGSRRSVAAIKAGFQAQVGRRIKPA